MPTDVDFPFPFTAPRPVPVAVEQARRRGVDWAVRHRLLQPTDAAIGRFTARRLADLAAGFCPKAGGTDLDVMTDVVTWAALCGDLFDGPAGDDPAFAGDVVRALLSTTAPYGEAGAAARVPVPAGAEGLVTATADLWERLRAPMTERWRERAGHNWARFLYSLTLRQEGMAMYLYLDAAERTGRYEVPERVLADPTARRLAELETDVLVLALEAGSGGHRAQVIDEIRHRVGGLAEEFRRLAAGLPALCDRLSCDPYERLSTERHLRAMTRQMRVTFDWSLATRRDAGRTVASGVLVGAGVSSVAVNAS
ncbi:hypothetical protein ACGFYU_00240 [Streptomyces sp. NPDC048337]|uniref:hypothetical protein n=1 Tax=Streptomyces sp. NPDC048337 TaxID=3365535 RepID=UPI003711B6B9